VLRSQETKGGASAFLPHLREVHTLENLPRHG